MSQPSLDILSLMPLDTPAYMFAGWLGCIRFALGDPGVMEAFRKDTGLSWKPATNGLERLIDEATGAEAGFIEAFVRWVNVNVWGPVDGKEPC